MRIAELVESIDLPPTQVAERAWDDAHRRVRRRRAAVVAGAAITVTCILAFAVVWRPDHTTTPSPAPSPTQTVEPHTAPVVQELLTGGRWRSELADMDYARFSGNLDRAAPLSADPVDRAVLAMGDPDDEAGALVLGEDGRWRRVDVPGLVPAIDDETGDTEPVLRPTSLSPDAARLALPQPNGLVVVDLADGSSRRYDVPGPGNVFALWADDDHVLVAEETARNGTLVDLRDGSLSRSAYGPTTTFLRNTTLTWGTGFRDTALRWENGRNVDTDANNMGGFFPQPPLVHDDVVVGVMGVVEGGGDLPSSTWGVVAVDGSTGRVLAYLPVTHTKGTASLLFGWDGDKPIIGVPLLKESSGLFVFAWDWRAGELEPIGHVGDWTSWGTGVVTE
jgi:hypothetical protein